VKVSLKGVEGFDQRVRVGSHLLRQGVEYVVLEISCQSDGPNHFRIDCSEDGIPPLFDSRMFEVLDYSCPSSWRPAIEWDGSITMGPPAWVAAGFWEDVMDENDQALEVYRYERGRILGDSGDDDSRLA
jgi:hypothetical protein